MISKKQKFIYDPELWFILVFNALILYLYLTDRVEPFFVIWAYFLQSLYVGAQYVVDALIYNTRLNGSFFPLKNHSFTFFFAVHFGGFHFVYFIFILIMSFDSGQALDLFGYVKLTVYYLLFSLVLHTIGQLNPRTMSIIPPNGFIPYLRLLPIHIYIIVGFNSEFFLDGFTTFMLLKILFDVIMYLVLRSRKLKYLP